MKQFSKMMLLALGFGLLTAVLPYIPSRPAVARRRRLRRLTK